MFGVHTELQALAAKLQVERTPYALCGTLALAVHGYLRATLDIDLLALAGSGERIRECARALRFTLEAAPREFAGGTVRIKRLCKVLPTSEDVLMLDVLTVSSEIENEVVVEVLDWEGHPLRTVDRMSLARLKMLRGSAQDIADLEKLRWKPEIILPTSAEITQRLRTVAELRNLCLSLGRARRVEEARCEVEIRGQEHPVVQLGSEEE